MTTNTASQIAMDTFLATFGNAQEGGSEKVAQEIAAFWQNKGTLGTPSEIFNHLMEERVKSGAISQQRAEILTRVFSDSFAPEHSTGFLAKHREPLVEGLAQLYVERIKPQTSIWRIEGDISNLGGLNRAMIASAEHLEASDRKAYKAMLHENGLRGDDNQAVNKLGRAMADKMLYTICQITLEHLQKKADVIPIRKGGDEISFVAVMKKGVSGDELETALKQTQTDVAQFVTSTGLIIPHDKYLGNRRKSGVGIGLHGVDMALHKPDAQRQLIAQGISTSKESYQELLHREEKIEIAIPDMQKLNELLSVFPSPPIVQYFPRLGTLEASNIPDDEHKKIKLFNTLESSDSGALLPTEERIAAGVHELVRKNDFVTNLPLFENMQDEQLPNFLSRFGNRGGGIRLVNVDFSNVAGGNELSESLGNAMLRSYKDVLLTSMSKSGLSEYTDGIAVRPGGKFALLIPSDTTTETMAEFVLQLQENLGNASLQPLNLTASEQQEIRRNITENKKLQAYYGAQGEKLQDKNTNLRIMMADIVHPKSRLKGVNVVMTYTKDPIALDTSLGDQLRPLELDAGKRHDQVKSHLLSSFTSRLDNSSGQNTGITR